MPGSEPATRRQLTVTVAPREPCCHDACCAVPTPTGPPPTARKHAIALAWLSVAWMTAEGVVGLVAGSEHDSVSLVGWALGSVIEGLASLIVIWRFTGARTVAETAERRAQQAVAATFFLLAPYIAVEAGRALAVDESPTVSLAGIVITAASLVFMPVLGVLKRRLGARLGSGATTGEGTQNLLCAAQAAAVLVGIVATATLGWSWVDPAIAFLLAVWAVREGVAAWNGDDCC